MALNISNCLIGLSINNAAVTIQQSGITSNGQGLQISDSYVEILDCHISGNYLKDQSHQIPGGGVYMINSNGTIANTFITFNRKASKGSGVCLNSSHPLITDSTISGNIITTIGQGGAGIFMQSSSPIITHSLLSDNSASVGAAISMDDSSPFLYNTTMLNNSLPGTIISTIQFLNTSDPPIYSNIIAIGELVTLTVTLNLPVGITSGVFITISSAPLFTVGGLAMQYIKLVHSGDVISAGFAVSMIDSDGDGITEAANVTIDSLSAQVCDINVFQLTSHLYC